MTATGRPSSRGVPTPLVPTVSSDSTNPSAARTLSISCAIAGSLAHRRSTRASGSLSSSAVGVSVRSADSRSSTGRAARRSRESASTAEPS